MRLRVKICCMGSVDEAAMAASAGADMVGLVGPMPSGAGVIDLATARVIAEEAVPWVTPVLLSSGETAEAIAEEAGFCRVRCMQIVRHVAPEVHRALDFELVVRGRIGAVGIQVVERLLARPAERVDAGVDHQARRAQLLVGQRAEVRKRIAPQSQLRP